MILLVSVKLIKSGMIMMENISEVHGLNAVPLCEAVESFSISN